MTISHEYAEELGRQIDELEAENAALRDALWWYAKDYDHALGCSQWDGGAKAREALASSTVSPSQRETGKP